MRKPKSFRLTEEAIAILADAARRAGISQTAVLELAIRRLAATDGDPRRTSDGGGERGQRGDVRA